MYSHLRDFRCVYYYAVRMLFVARLPGHLAIWIEYNAGSFWPVNSLLYLSRRKAKTIPDARSLPDTYW